MTHAGHPLRRTQNLSVQPIGETGEILVYDELQHLAFCLDRTAAALWSLADGTRSPAQIAAAASTQLPTHIPEEVALLTLRKLSQNGLITLEMKDLLASSLSRRTLLGRLGAGAALMLPAIAIIAAPTAAQAYNVCLDCSFIPPEQPEEPPVHHERQLGLPIYDPNHVHDRDNSDPEQ